MPFSALSAEQLGSLVRATASVTWSLSPDGFVIDVPQWCELTGQSAEQAAGSGWLDAIHPDDRDRVSMAWQSAIAHGHHYNTDYRILCADGSYRWFNARGTPLRSKDGAIERWVGFCLEIPGLWRFSSAEPSRNATGKTENLLLDASILRAARAMLNWSAADLADRSGVSVSTIRRLEDDHTTIQARRSNNDRLVAAFVEAGLSFASSEHGVDGLRWTRRETRPPA